jgi:glutamine synthetase
VIPAAEFASEVAAYARMLAHEVSPRSLREMKREIWAAQFQTLGDAIDAFEADPLSEAVFGSRMFAAYRDFKRNEWHSYQSHVTDWELDRYLTHF